MDLIMTPQSRIFSSLIFMMVFLFASLGFAQKKSFQQYLDLAEKAYAQEDYPKAIENLFLAYSVEKNPRLLFNVAKSYQKLGECDKAIVYFRAFRRQPSAGVDLRAQAKTEIGKSASCQTIKPLSGRFFIKSDPKGAKVTLDGIEMGFTPLETAGHKASTHELVLELEGYESVSTSFEALAGNDQLINKKLNLKTEGDFVEEPDLVTEKEDSNLLPYIIAGSVSALGLGVLGFGTFTDLVTIPDLKEARIEVQAEVEKGGPADVGDVQELTDDIDASISTAIVSYVIGGTLLAGGVGYFAYILATDSANTDGLVIAPAISTQGFGIHFSKTF